MEKEKLIPEEREVKITTLYKSMVNQDNPGPKLMCKIPLWLALLQFEFMHGDVEVDWLCSHVVYDGGDLKAAEFRRSIERFWLGEVPKTMDRTYCLGNALSDLDRLVNGQGEGVESCRCLRPIGCNRFLHRGIPMECLLHVGDYARMGELKFLEVLRMFHNVVPGDPWKEWRLAYRDHTETHHVYDREDFYNKTKGWNYFESFIKVKLVHKSTECPGWTVMCPEYD